MYSIIVGKQFDGNYKQEGIRLEYNGGFNLNIFMSNLTTNEIDDIRDGAYTFGLTLIDEMLFFTCAFGESILISDAPFHFGLYKDDRVKELPKEVFDGEGLILNIIAVDSKTGIVKAIRVLAFSNTFSKELLRICLEQNEKKIDGHKYDIQLMKTQNMYSSYEIYENAFVKCFSGVE